MNIHNELMEEISSLEINCPECASVDDEQYQCSTCNGQGSDGKINVLKYLRYNELFSLLSLMTSLTKLKFGNLDPEIWEKIQKAEKLIREMKG